MSELLLNKIENIEKRLNSVEIKEDSHVTYYHFYWIIGVLLTIVICLFGVIYMRQEEGLKDSSSIRQSVSKIEGKLEPYDIEYKN